VDEIRFSCELCSKTLAVPASAVGRRIVCPHCNGLNIVPDASAAGEPAAPAEPAPPSQPAPAEPAPGPESLDLASDQDLGEPGPAPEGIVVRTCERCGATTRLGTDFLGKEAQCATCFAPLPPGPSEVVDDMEYPDKPNPMATTAGWLASLGIHCLLFLTLTGVTFLPSMGTSMESGPVGIAEDEGEVGVSVAEPEPVEVQPAEKMPELAPKPDKVEPIPETAVEMPKLDNEAILPTAVGAGTSKPDQLATIAIVGGSAGGSVAPPSGGAAPGGAATSYGGLMRNRGGSGKGRALAKFGGRDTQPAVKKGLKWLAQNQQSDGGWKGIGTTSLVLLAFLGDGHTTRDGRYKQVVRKGFEYLLGQTRADGERIIFPGNMYHQGLAAFALAEEFAMSKNSRIRSAARGALLEVNAAQYTGGGWRYSRGGSRQGDTSVTGWQIMALKAGKDSGLCKPTESFRKALEFLNGVKQEASDRAGFGYTSPGQSYNLSAVGLVCLQFMRVRDHDLMHKVARLLMGTGPARNGRPTQLYGLYYATIGIFQMGGKYWKAWNTPMKKALMGSQHPDGHWDTSLDHHSNGSRFPDAYTTALAVLTLEVYYHYAPLGIK
jgi:hypothetical protein